MKFRAAFVIFFLLLVVVFHAQNKTLDSLDLAFRNAKTTGNYKIAFQNYKLFIQLRDSFNKASALEAGIKHKLQFEYAKKAATDSMALAKETEVKNVELKKQDAELKVKRILQYALYGGILLVIIFSAYMYNRYKVSHKQKLVIEEKEKQTQQQNRIITEQKNIMEEKQNEILSSILYAQRIQKALLPNEIYFDKKLKELKRNWCDTVLK